MTIFIGADHRGYQLKDKLIEYLQSNDIRVEDLGNYEYDPQDDFPTFANKVSQAVLQNPKEYLGIVICGSGAGVCIAANRHKGIYSAIALNPEQIKSARSHDHINILALASDHTSFDEAKELVDTFLQTELNTDQKYERRLQMLDQTTE
jgi:ribose 5-phosphate isomerase B